MQLAQVLDVLEALFRVSEHPDIAAVERYDHAQAGIKVKYGTGSSGLLFGDDKPGEIRIDMLSEPLLFRWRAPYTVLLAVRLLDAAKPAPFRSWHLIAVPSVGHDKDQISGLRIECSDGASIQLRATGMSSQTPEPDEDPARDYQVPEGVQSSWQQVSAASAGRL